MSKDGACHFLDMSYKSIAIMAAVVKKIGQTRLCTTALLAAMLVPFSFLAALLDPHEVSNREYLSFVEATGHTPPEHWIKGRHATGMEDEPVVLVSWHDAMAYCRWLGKRLPAVDEWMTTCKNGKLKKRGDVWEWSSTDVEMGGGTFKALCGPMGSCDCSHRYHPEWKNEVKGFRCAQSSLPLTWLPLLFGQNIFS